ncbi:MAG: GMC family oxidoreductase N-terminal domain-containing protein [Aquisalinus sp.]|nr:GMC family oxidoreductase N-terminal domain-containing protein [Aquisalinus sp.]
MQTTFDYIIVGAGSAGCVMASRLSENPRVSVCLLEAGKNDSDFRIHIPAMLPELLGSTVIDWNYYTEPQENLDRRRLFWPRGKTLGGSSSLNGMCYQRGDLTDYDDWADAGAEGWSAMDALHYFKKSEDYSGGESQWHGAGGPLGVRKADWVQPATERFIEAGVQAGYRRIDDFHADGREGVGYYDTTIRNGKRCSTATAYLPKDVRARPNLTIFTEALARRVHFEGKRAGSVRTAISGTITELTAAKEVILCGGAINTPQLLLLSGVGPSDHLAEHDIELVSDLPGVGSNLQDHLDVALMFKTKPGSTFGYTFGSVPGIVKGVGDYMRHKTGLFASNFAEATGFAKSSPDLPKADIQFIFLPAFGEDHAKTKVWGQQGLTIHACCLYPKSAGTIRLASNDPKQHPLIDPHYLDAEEDMFVLTEGAKQAFDISQQSALSEIISGYWAPEERPESEADWARFIRARAETIYHPVGTAKMGRHEDEMAVTDNMGRVHGVENLRVVDASLMPIIMGGNTNAPVIMMAEKIVEQMKAA